MKDNGLSKTEYPGVFFRMEKSLDGKGQERCYYIRYRLGGRGSKEIREPVGRASKGWTPAKANIERMKRMTGKSLSNRAKREEALKSNEAATPKTLDDFWGVYQKHILGKACFMGDKNRYNKHIGPLLGSRFVDSITTPDIVLLKENAEKNGLAPQTVKHILSQVKRILKYMQKLGGYVMPPNLFFDMPHVDNQKTETLTQEQLNNYVKCLDEEHDQDSATIIRLALYTGMRVGAILGLQWNDIDFEKGQIRLRGENAKKGKTEYIPLTQSVASILQKVSKTPSSYIFPGINGEKRKYFHRMAARVRDKAGLPKSFRPMHGLRHAYASALASSGKVDLYTLQKLLTHESPQMTQRYAHLADEAKKRAASVIDDIISQALSGE